MAGKRETEKQRSLERGLRGPKKVFLFPGCHEDGPRAAAPTAHEIIDMLIMKKRLIATVVIAPFLLYGFQAVSRFPEGQPPAPADFEPLEAEKAKKWRKQIGEKNQQAQQDIQSAARFEPPDEDAPAFKKALKRRAWAVKNALSFARDDKEPDFRGDDKEDFKKLRDGEGALRKLDRDLKAWFRQEAGPESLGRLQGLLQEYSQANGSPIQVAVYEMRGRHRVAKWLSSRLEEDYNRLIVNTALPMKEAEAKPLLEQADKLAGACAEFDSVYSSAPNQARTTVDMENLATDIKLLRDGWQARKELSELFSRDPARMPPAAIANWFLKLGGHMSKLSPMGTKALITQKAQQFCAAVIPEKLALDDNVEKIGGNSFQRNQLQARFRKFGAGLDDPDLYKRLPLSLDPAGLNERTHGNRNFSPPGYEASMIETPGGAVPTEKFNATPRSAAAFDYHEARQQVPLENGWTPAALDRMLEAAAKSEKEHKQKWDLLPQLGEEKQGPCNVHQKLKAIRAAMTNLETKGLFPDR